MSKLFRIYFGDRICFPIGLRILQKKIVRRYYAKQAAKNEYISTPIFYVNAAPHIGHLYSAVLADCITRYRSMLGHNTFLSTGTDEHGNKVQAAAESAAVPLPDYCAQISDQFKMMCDKFLVNYSAFIRTTEPHHAKAVHHFWNRLDAREHIYLGRYSGWYCMSDEAFLSDSEVYEKKDTFGNIIKISMASGHPVEWMEEENYKFRLSALRDDLKYWLKRRTVIQPAKYHKMVTEWLESEDIVHDLSISRPTSRVPWSLRTPQNKHQSIYVWFDALVNYLTVLGYPNDTYKQFWPPKIQVVGKDILKFHGIYWPAFLIAAGLEPPQTLLCHAHWMVDNGKMSKSRGNVISPFAAATTFTEDGLRYSLLREAVPHKDSNYSINKMTNILNTELADTLGNLIYRCTGKIINPWHEIPDPVEYDGVLKSSIAIKLIDNIKHLGQNTQSHYESFNLHHVVDATISTLHNTNQMIDHHKPWLLRRKLDDPNNVNQLKAVISLALECARISSLILYPIMPRLATNILDFLAVPVTNRTWYDTASQYQNQNLMGNRNINSDSMMLFKKINSL